jgi:hypothetical protein
MTVYLMESDMQYIVRGPLVWEGRDIPLGTPIELDPAAAAALGNTVLPPTPDEIAPVVASDAGAADEIDRT